MDVTIKIADRNIPIQLFWRKFIGEYTDGKYEEFIGKTPDGDEKIIFRFSSEK